MTSSIPTQVTKHKFKDARTSLFFDCWRRPIVAHIRGVRHEWHERQGWVGHYYRRCVLLRFCLHTKATQFSIIEHGGKTICAWLGWMNYACMQCCSPFKLKSSETFRNLSLILLKLCMSKAQSTVIFIDNFYSCTHRLRVFSKKNWKYIVIYVMNVLFSLTGIVLCYFHPCRDIVTAELRVRFAPIFI